MKKMYVVQETCTNGIDEKVTFFERLIFAKNYALNMWDKLTPTDKRHKIIIVASCETCEKNDEGNWGFAEVDGIVLCDYKIIYRIYQIKSKSY